MARKKCPSLLLLSPFPPLVTSQRTRRGRPSFLFPLSLMVPPSEPAECSLTRRGREGEGKRKEEANDGEKKREEGKEEGKRNGGERRRRRRGSVKGRMSHFCTFLLHSLFFPLSKGEEKCMCYAPPPPSRAVVATHSEEQGVAADG